MHRSIATFALVILGSALFPARADAYFWEWVDSLSGPKFRGSQVEWRVWCNSSNVLEQLRNIENAELAFYRAAARDASSQGAKDNLELAQKATEKALASLGLASMIAATGDSSQLVALSLKSRTLAAEYAEASRSESKAPKPGGAPSESSLDEANIQARSDQKMRLFFGGVAVSLCKAEPFERTTRFLSANFGWAYDAKAGNENDHNRMVTIGASYHSVVKPYLTIGIGGGLAVFSSGGQETFQKLYVEPYIIDIRPLAFRRNSTFMGPWWHVFFFRYKTIIFPTGFEPERFGGRSPQYPAELVHSIGFHADLEPVIRKLQGKW